MSHDIFLSYASNDIAAAKQIRRYFQHRGVKVWIDYEDLVPGENWEEGLKDAARRVDLVVALYSTHYFDKLKPQETPTEELQAIQRATGVTLPDDVSAILPSTIGAKDTLGSKKSPGKTQDATTASASNDLLQKLIGAMKAAPRTTREWTRLEAYAGLLGAKLIPLIIEPGYDTANIPEPLQRYHALRMIPVKDALAHGWKNRPIRGWLSSPYRSMKHYREFDKAGQKVIGELKRKAAPIVPKVLAKKTPSRAFPHFGTVSLVMLAISAAVISAALWLRGFEASAFQQSGWLLPTGEVELQRDVADLRRIAGEYSRMTRVLSQNIFSEEVCEREEIFAEMARKRHCYVEVLPDETLSGIANRAGILESQMHFIYFANEDRFCPGGIWRSPDVLAQYERIRVPIFPLTDGPSAGKCSDLN